MDFNHVSHSKNTRLPPSWGRHGKAGSLDTFYAAGVLLCCPVVAIVSFIAVHHFDGSIVAVLVSLSGTLSANGTQYSSRDWVRRHVPQPSVEGFAIYAAWIIFQVFLFVWLPGPQAFGQVTPAGHLLAYKVNGLAAWIVTMATFVFGAGLGFWEISVVARNWGSLLVAANVYGYSLSIFAYIKAQVFPTHPSDNKWSGCWIYDLYMGIELNPRFGRTFDFKLFHNGRPGIIAWAIINMSFTAHQYEKYGTITLSAICVNLLQLLYVLDFFYNEDWYLRTIDIAHDHFGFYLAWGDSVWLPQMYTLQSQYLSCKPGCQPTSITLVVFTLGLLGYWLFRSANHQKDLARKTNGKCVIWGRSAKVIRAGYMSADGLQHTSLLLCSGWWGICRHANYLGDLIQAFAVCRLCGYGDLLPFSYLVFMSVLLLHRTARDNERCSIKYGLHWDLYTRRVRWRLIPGVY